MCPENGAGRYTAQGGSIHELCTETSEDEKMTAETPYRSRYHMYECNTRTPGVSKAQSSSSSEESSPFFLFFPAPAAAA